MFYVVPCYSFFFVRFLLVRAVLRASSLKFLQTRCVFVAGGHWCGDVALRRMKSQRGCHARSPSQARVWRCRNCWPVARTLVVSLWEQPRRGEDWLGACLCVCEGIAVRAVVHTRKNQPVRAHRQRQLLSSSFHRKRERVCARSTVVCWERGRRRSRSNRSRRKVNTTPVGGENE